MSGIFPTADICLRVAILAIDFLKSGFLNFLNGGAIAISFSSSSGYSRNNSYTVVDGLISSSFFVRNRVFFIVCTLVFVFGQTHAIAAEKVSVVTSIFPLYDFTVQVGGDLVDVKLMLPPGVEAHGFSPTPKNMIAVKRADLFLYTSDILEPWAGTIVAAVGVRDGKVVEVGKEIISATTGHTDHNKQHRGLDPHIWLDPALAVEMVEVIIKQNVKMVFLMLLQN